MRRSSYTLFAAAAIFIAAIVMQSAMFAAARTEGELMAMAANTDILWVVLAAIIIAVYGLLLRRKGK